MCSSSAACASSAAFVCRRQYSACAVRRVCSVAHRRGAGCPQAAQAAPPGLAPPHGLWHRQPSQEVAPRCVGCTAQSVQRRARSQLLPPARTAAVTRALAARVAQRAVQRRHRGLAIRSGGGARRRGATRQRRRCTDERKPVKRSVGASQRRACSKRTTCQQRPSPTDPRRGPRLGARSSRARRQRGLPAVC